MGYVIYVFYGSYVVIRKKIYWIVFSLLLCSNYVWKKIKGFIIWYKVVSEEFYVGYW